MPIPEGQVDDIIFSLRHVAQASKVFDWDDALAEDVFRHFSQLAHYVIAPLSATGDAEGARLVDGKVRMPSGFREAYRDLANDGWQGLVAPERFGGQGLSRIVSAGVSEIFTSADQSMQMVCNLVPGAIDTLLKFGSTEQQDEWIPKLASGETLATMCLTEPNAGSDLSGIRCGAIQDGATWRVSGEKIFISGGDQDLSDSIIHLILARSGQPEDGIGGLSLFLCPSQSGVSVSRIESKLGLHASPTCHMHFDNAEATLIGEQGKGLAALFTIMNHARVDVALQGVAQAAKAARIAKDYATERKQGRKSDGSAARLSDHADVRRMLNEQQWLSYCTRSICHITLVELEWGKRPALVEFLTPLCKIAGSEAGIKSADLAIQIMGGYGYLNDYGVEQIWRDVRITAIYEGANGIHARSLATRGLRDGGGAEEFAELVCELAGDDSQVLTSLEQWQDQKQQLLKAENPLPLAQSFAAASVLLLQRAVWVKIRSKAHEHRNAHVLLQLAEFEANRGDINWFN